MVVSVTREKRDTQTYIHTYPTQHRKNESVKGDRPIPKWRRIFDYFF